MDELTLGDKIKYYRLRAKKSQLDLELETGLSTGTISRIENGNINPTKETLTKIAERLSLKPSEIAYLLGLKIFSIYELTEAIEKISNSITLEATLQTTVDIMYDLYPNYNGGLLFLLDKDNRNILWVKTVSKLEKIDLAFKLLKRRLDAHSFDLNKNVHSYAVKSLLENRVYQSNSLIDFGKGAESDFIIESVGNVLGYKYGISIPLYHESFPIGVAVFTKRVSEKFSEDEQKTLILLGTQISKLLYNSIYKERGIA